WDDQTAQHDAEDLRRSQSQTDPAGLPALGNDRTLEAPVPDAVARVLAGKSPFTPQEPMKEAKMTMPAGSGSSKVAAPAVSKVATPIEKVERAERTPKAEPRATAPT